MEIETWEASEEVQPTGIENSMTNAEFVEGNILSFL
jgi:hypothetical protein